MQVRDERIQERTTRGAERLRAGGLMALFLCLVGCAGTGVVETPWVGLQKLEIDAVHSSVTFEIDHLGTSRATGRFNGVSGDLVMDHDDPAHCRIEVAVDAASVDTNSTDRDGHLQGDAFFNTDEYPSVTFVSSHFDAAGTGAWNVTGVLTLHGRARPVTALVRYVGSSATENFGPRSGYQATFSILRSDFGMNTYIENLWLGDEVLVTVNIEALHR